MNSLSRSHMGQKPWGCLQRQMTLQYKRFQYLIIMKKSFPFPAFLFRQEPIIFFKTPTNPLIKGIPQVFHIHHTLKASLIKHYYSNTSSSNYRASTSATCPRLSSVDWTTGTSFTYDLSTWWRWYWWRLYIIFIGN